MTDEFFLGRGYKEYAPTSFDNSSVVKRFQKRFDDEFGKKYFINVLKYSLNYLPTRQYMPTISYTYEVQVSMFKDAKALNFEFFSDWALDEVERFMRDFFVRMKPNYYESWNEERGVRP